MYFALYAYQEDARRLRGVCASTRALDAHRVPLPAPFGQERPGVPGSGSTSWTPRPRASPSSTRTGWWFPRSAGSRRPARRASPCGTCSPSTRPRPGLTHIMRRPRAHRPCAGVVGWHARRNTWRSAHRAEWERCSGDALRCDREPVTPAPDGLPGQRYRQRRARDRRPRRTRDPLATFNAAMCRPSGDRSATWSGPSGWSPGRRSRNVVGAEYCIRAAQPLLELVYEDAAATGPAPRRRCALLAEIRAPDHVGEGASDSAFPLSNRLRAVSTRVVFGEWIRW